MMKIHGRSTEVKSQVEEDPLIESIILLLVRLGGLVNRKIFIPGESREK